MRAFRALLHRPWRLFWLIALYSWDLLIANAVVAWEVVTPRHYVRPGIVRVPLVATSDFEIALLANMVSFTPGTLTLEVTEDRTALYVHVLHMDSPEDVRRQVSRLEGRLLRVLR